MRIINWKGQTSATIESMLFNADNAIWNSHRGQTAAIQESHFSNADNAIWNRHRGQTSAVQESTISNAGNAIWDNIPSLKIIRTANESFSVMGEFYSIYIKVFIKVCHDDLYLCHNIYNQFSIRA